VPPIVPDHEKAVEQAEGHGRDREEVHGGDGLAVIAEKSQPSSSRLRVSRCSLHPAGDAPFRHVKAEHQQFTVNAGSAPSGVLCNHTEDEFSDFLRDSFSSHALSYSGDDAPEQAESGPVPTHDRFWRDYDEVLFPRGPEATSDDPEEPVSKVESGLRTQAFPDRELLPEGEIFQKQISAGATDPN
jgi:hypothetical protein